MLFKREGQMDEIIVWVIVAIAVAYTVKSVVASLGKKGSDGCGGCAGCGGCSQRGDCTLEQSDSVDLEPSQTTASIQTCLESKNTVK
jgi:hypothetical protein